MSNNVHEILAAITAASAAYDRVPQLEAVIADHADTITLLRMELDEMKSLLDLKTRNIEQLSAALTSTEHDLGMERDRNASLEAKVYELTNAHNKAQATITDQASTIEANAILLTLLEADKASLTARLADYDNIGDKLKLAISKAAPAVVEATASTFPQPVGSGEGSVQIEPVQSGPVVEAVRVATDPVIEEPKIDGESLDWLKEPNAEPEIKPLDYNSYNRF